MSKQNGIAYHGTSVAPAKLQELGGILPRVGWQKPELAKEIALRLPEDLQNRIYSYVGPVLRGDPTAGTGAGDADPNLSVSLTWSPRVACFFPPKHRNTYVYLVNMNHTPWLDVDRFAETVGVDRSYMKEIAVSNILWCQIAGYFQLVRKEPPRNIKNVAGHKMEVEIGPYIPLVTNSEIGSIYKEEIAAIPTGLFGLSDKPEGIVGTFHTLERHRTQPKEPGGPRKRTRSFNN
jgi:hypothetical protein